MISFIIPSFNSVTWLPSAVTSCLEQTYKDIEVVVIDDGSTDRTGDYLDWLQKDSRVKIIHNPTNLGRSLARNIGNKAAQGEILCVLDSDDLATPNRAEIIAKKFSVGDFDYIYGAATVANVLGIPQHIIMPDVFDKDKALDSLQNRIIHSTVAYTKQFSEKYPYRANEIAELGIDDWCQQIESKLDGAKFDFVPQRLCVYRILNSQITKTRDENKVLEVKKAFLESLKIVA